MLLAPCRCTPTAVAAAAVVFIDFFRRRRQRGSAVLVRLVGTDEEQPEGQRFRPLPKSRQPQQKLRCPFQEVAKFDGARTASLINVGVSRSTLDGTEVRRNSKV